MPPCEYAQIGEIDVNINQVLQFETGNTTNFDIHFDSVPTFYVEVPGEPLGPGQFDPVTRQLEKNAGSLTGINPITGNTADPLLAAMADQAEQNFLHMITSDAKRTPTFIMFGNPDYFYETGTQQNCTAQTLANCFVVDNGFAWNHGDIQPEITTTWLAMVGPGVKNLGQTNAIFTDHTDSRPTVMALTGLKDDYVHDGRMIAEIIDPNALPTAVRQSPDFVALAEAYKAINAPLGPLGQKTLTLDTKAILGDDHAYEAFNHTLVQLTNDRNVIGQQMITLLENAAFAGKPIPRSQADELIFQAQVLGALVFNLP
jgi:hypothetical protein